MTTRAWDNASYDGATTNAALIDDMARQLRQDIWDLLAQGGIKVTGSGSYIPPASSAFTPNDGKPCIGWETQTYQADGANDNKGFRTLCWNSAGTTPLLRQYGALFDGTALNGRTIDHTINPSIFEVSGNIIGPAGVKFEGMAYAAVVRACMYDALPQASTALKRIIYKAPNATGSPTRTITRATLIVGGKPSSANLVVNIYKVVAAAGVAYDRFTVGASHSPLGTVTLNASTNFAVEVTGLAYSLAPDDEVVVIYGTTGNATDLTILFQIE